MKIAALVPLHALYLALALATGTATVAGAADAALEVHVAPSGDDTKAGTAAAPLKTFAAAQKAARAAKAKAPAKAVTVLFHRGTYYLPEIIVFTAEDSGTKAAPVVYSAVAGEEVVISGGLRLELAWEPWKDGIMKAKVPEGMVFDQLFVAGNRQPMARYPNFDANVAHFNGYAADAFSPARAARWKDPTGGYIHAMHSAEWGGYHYRITGKDADNKVTYEGGWQNNRPGAMHDQLRMVENIFEELDAPGEWFHDAKTATLYYYPAAGVDMATAAVEGVRLRHLLEWRGDEHKPVRFVSCKGLTFRHAARTFMDTKEPLLRSDWTTYRGGALFVNGAEDCAIAECMIDQVGGNAVFVNGYNRRITVTGCIIEKAGANGVAFVGDPKAVRNALFNYGESLTVDKLDLTPGPKTNDYPADCLVDDCIIHASGRVEKQTAGVQIEMAARITVKDCSIYGVPRAGINIGDGCWGGHLVDGCDVFDTVLETGDHGSFNSWGRDRYWVPDVGEVNRRVAGSPTLPLLDVVEPNTLRNSRWRCDHGWDIDLDDGSSNYRLINNLTLNGGIKLREGYNRVVENNIMVNNSFHFHVWFAPSHDLVRHNIVFTTYRPIGMPKPWGDECDGNLLYNPDLPAPLPATVLSDASGRDGKSLTGDARFTSPQTGDWSVAKDSPAVALGFVSFPTDRYGVRSPRLRALAKQPQLPGGAPIAKPTGGAFRDELPSDWLGARIKNVVGLGEVSATGLPGETGVLITALTADGVLAKAGAQKMDVLRSLNGNAFATMHDLVLAYASKASGKRVKLGIWRNQKEATLEIEGERGILLGAGRATYQGEGRTPGFDRDKDYLGSWTNPDVALVWKTNLVAGTYDVEVVSAVTPGDAGTTFRVSAGDQKVEGTVPATSDWETFTAYSVGPVTIATAGASDVVLKAIKMKGGAVMNLRAVVLTRR